MKDSVATAQKQSRWFSPLERHYSAGICESRFAQWPETHFHSVGHSAARLSPQVCCCYMLPKRVSETDINFVRLPILNMTRPLPRKYESKHRVRRMMKQLTLICNVMQVRPPSAYDRNDFLSLCRRSFAMRPHASTCRSGQARIRFFQNGSKEGSNKGVTRAIPVIHTICLGEGDNVLCWGGRRLAGKSRH